MGMVQRHTIEPDSRALTFSPTAPFPKPGSLFAANKHSGYRNRGVVSCWRLRLLFVAKDPRAVAPIGTLSCGKTLDVR